MPDLGRAASGVRGGCLAAAVLVCMVTGCAPPPQGVAHLPNEADLHQALAFSLHGSHGYQDGETVFLNNANPVPIHVVPALVVSDSPLDVGGVLLERLETELIWSLGFQERDATGERVLRDFDALRPPALQEVGLASRRILDPGSAGGLLVIDATLTATVRDRGRRGLMRAGAHARLHLLAPLTVPSASPYEALEALGMGRYLNPANPKDIETATKLAGGVTPQHVVQHAERYQPPRHLYLCSELTHTIALSPHLALGDVALRDPWPSLGLPQHVAHDPLLTDKFEDVVERLRAAGLTHGAVRVIHGFRPPRFNLAAIETHKPGDSLKEPFSLHQYGKALGIIVDNVGNQRMDDLNGDGAIDLHDAAVIMHHVNELDRAYREADDPRMGGAGLYAEHGIRQRQVRSPYCHFDVRGYQREDGTLIRWSSTDGKWPDGGDIRHGQINAQGRQD